MRKPSFCASTSSREVGLVHAPHPTRTVSAWQTYVLRRIALVPVDVRMRTGDAFGSVVSTR